MNAAQTAVTLFRRCRTGAACLLAAAAMLLLWAALGLSSLLPFSAPAVAGAENDAGVPPPLSGQQAALLQSTVDSLALSLGGAFSAAFGEGKDAGARQLALSGALSALTFKLGADVYFTAWQGTRVIHSPLSPDAAQMDFSAALDSRGAAFVRGMERLAGNGGGFLRVSLPRQLAAPATLPGAGVYTAPVKDIGPEEAFRQPAPNARDGLAAPAALRPGVFSGPFPEVEENGLFCAPQDACPLPGGPLPACPPRYRHEAPAAEPVEQVVYVRAIPGSAWHIAAFMPAAPGPAHPRTAFSPVWSAAGTPEDTARDGLLSRGLYLSGFSLAGLAGLMLTPARRREPGGGPGPAREESSPGAAQGGDGA